MVYVYGILKIGFMEPPDAKSTLFNNKNCLITKAFL